ncbi:hypothetical protein [Paenibacillus kandeliae]|uniref:hypothetical protein n=1 Tax=Paenibacillus kandeliae TaxID=3231269 RepID=UPI00345A4D67
MEPRTFRYKDFKSENYASFYSNASLTSISPRGEIAIDFYEEKYDPFLITEQVFDENNQVTSTEYSRDIHEIVIERERKCSVTLNKQQALELAEWIINNFGDDGEEHRDEDQE